MIDRTERLPGASLDVVALEHLAFAHWMDPDPLQQNYQLTLRESLPAATRKQLRCLFNPPTPDQSPFPRERCGLGE